MYSIKQFRSHWANKTINYSVLVFVTLVSLVLITQYLQVEHYDTPLILGVIAAALAIEDDTFCGRIKSYSLALVCFAIAAFSVHLLYPYPALFALGLVLSTFAFVMLGAIGDSYRTLSFGSLLLAIYAMLGAGNYTSMWLQPALLLSGAFWFFFVSLLWHLITPMHPVRQNLADVFATLSKYFTVKSQRFHPHSGQPDRQLGIDEAKLNSTVVTALNQCKSILLSHSKKVDKKNGWKNYLNIYFLAQDIHERIRSSHIKYEELVPQFMHSDIMFRFKYLLEQQALSCQKISNAISVGKVYRHDTAYQEKLSELEASLDYAKHLNHYSEDVMDQLAFLYKNLATVEELISNIDAAEPHFIDENSLYDPNAKSIRSIFTRIKSSMTIDNPLFRHAIRLSSALLIGYAALTLLPIEHGYWIILTTLFVCQPSYSATKQKLVTRSLGTVTGLLIGTPLLALFPSPASQITFIVISAVLFFSFRVKNYGYATAFITLLVLFCFAQVGDGYQVVFPRLLNTLLGCFISVLAVMYLLPDWQSKKLSKLMSEALDANLDYLDNILAQYRTGKKDSLGYRITRRNAHDKDADLNVAVRNMAIEPSKYRVDINESLRFLMLNHSLLGYISALGAHRKRINDAEIHKLILNAHHHLRHRLKNCSKSLSIADSPTLTKPNDNLSRGTNMLYGWPINDDVTVQLVSRQLQLIDRAIADMETVSTDLLQIYE
ncbi:YccS family putative transporter [Vibrio sp. S4M6]|uniref:YccS family putative transporter n=1 Tax=Vibrio sinus TaxID=2946865 RepID=UPI00202A4D9E|nr:YccS family putative transporter [Vibrio sinus]MCL9779860.1 YccS family putative transporter [Vibrio sinus]